MPGHSIGQSRPQNRAMLQYSKDHRFHLGIIATIAWVANYLHFASFGLYEDDWFFVGFPFLVTFKDWMVSSLFDQFKPQYFLGRPLQMILGYAFAEVGALAKSLALDYVIAYVLFVASAMLVYEVLSRRFSALLALFAAMLFVLTPLHTLHQFLNGQYSFGPGFIFVFCAILLYLRRRYWWSYVVALLSLFCYESIFFLFAGAPLLEKGNAFRGRRTEWLRHLFVFAALLAAYFLGRELIGETRVAAVPKRGALLVMMVREGLFQACASFTTYVYGALRAREAALEGWLYGSIFVLLLACLFLKVERQGTTPRETVKTALWSVVVGMIFILLGYSVAYFFFKEPAPHFHATDRDTRISVASSFGSSIFVAGVLSAWIGAARSRVSRLVAYGGTSLVFLAMFLYSFVLQQDYIADWQEQRTEAAQMMSLTPDVERDSLIVLELHVPGAPFFTNGPRRRAIGIEKTLYEYQFGRIFASGSSWPRLFIVYSDAWPRFLKVDADGLMSWTAPTFHGRWYPATGDVRCRPGRFVFLEEMEPGWIVRHSAAIFADGRQIIQPAPGEVAKAPLWASMRVTALSRALVPAYAWKSNIPQRVLLGGDTVIGSDAVTFAWTSVEGAQDYWIDVGTAPAKGNIYAGFTKGRTEATVNLAGHLTGETIHVQLYPKYPGKEFVAGAGAKFEYLTINHAE